jgi:hypothetical protein
MFVAERHFLIPESPQEIALLKSSNHLKETRLRCNDREFTCYTEVDEDDGLVHDYLSRINNKFYFAAIVLEKELSPQSLANYIVEKHAPEIVIDIRTEIGLSKYNIDHTKAKLELNGIKYRWVPRLSEKGEFKYGMVEAKTLLKNYRRICFIGNREQRLSRVCRLLKRANHLTI